MNCQAEVKVKRISPALINAEDVTVKVQETARHVLPQATHDNTPYLTMGAEDMAFMQEKVNGCYFFIGSNNPEKHLDYGHHHPKFDFDGTSPDYWLGIDVRSGDGHFEIK